MNYFYKTGFYVMDSKTMKLLSGYDMAVRRDIQERHGKHLKEILTKKRFKATMIVSNLRKKMVYGEDGEDVVTLEMKTNYIKNDLNIAQSFMNK